jgi:large subunit ribosomal protein L28
MSPDGSWRGRLVLARLWRVAHTAGIQVAVLPLHGPAKLSRRLMSKVCSICGRKPGFGNNRSHSMVATRRRFNPNLQQMRILLNGSPMCAYVCTRCLKSGKVTKAV